MKTYDIDDTLLLAKELHEDARVCPVHDFCDEHIQVPTGTNFQYPWEEFNPLSDSICVALQTKFLIGIEWTSSVKSKGAMYPVARQKGGYWQVAHADTINEAVASVVLAIIKGRE